MRGDEERHRRLLGTQPGEPARSDDVVRDPGPGFDPASIPSPIMGENIYATHGRGIFLINQLVDEVQFERNGAEIHMRFK